MNDSMSHVGPFISESEIKRFEQQFALTLPVEYINFLLVNNGGAPERRFFLLVGFENNPIGQVQLFFSINSAVPSRNLDWNYETFVGRIPSHLLPIARDDGGNLVCISLSADNYGAVLYWDHNSEDASAGLANTYHIADGFAKFRQNMYSEDPS